MGLIFWMGYLQKWGVIIDEIQRKPDGIALPQSINRSHNLDIKLLLLGSPSRALLWQASETLAGRIQYIALTPFRLGEIDNISRL